jgi:hypothetical protein
VYTICQNFLLPKVRSVSIGLTCIYRLHKLPKPELFNLHFIEYVTERDKGSYIEPDKSSQ